LLVENLQGIPTILGVQDVVVLQDPGAEVANDRLIIDNQDGLRHAPLQVLVFISRF